MCQRFVNAYENSTKADSYSRLEFPNTYYLAYRDLPEIILRHVKGGRALDFGCGAGRSTRFLARLGFGAVGVDISAGMIKRAREIDPNGDYRLIGNGDFSQFERASFDFAQAIFTFDNIPGRDNRVRILAGLRDLLKPSGRLLLLDSTPEMYTNEWASFTTKDFPENARARSGDGVWTITTDIDDPTPVEDILWSHEDYLESFEAAGLGVAETRRPLGRPDEPYEWVTETKLAPWVIYVLKRRA
jgi:SAM-dependent methyltransferase